MNIAGGNLILANSGMGRRMKDSDSNTDLLAIALESAEQKLAECETVLTAALAQTNAASPQAPQSTEDLQTLRRRLEAKEEQLRALHQELRQRDERISQLERLCADNADAWDVADHDVATRNLTSRSARVVAMGLVLESLDEPGVVHRISRIATTIGRALDNDIALRSISASRYHARIVVASDSTYLIDLQSSNGCHVNGERISRQVIGDGDVIAIGNAKFRFAADVALSQADRSMDETQILLDDSVIFSPAPTSQGDTTREQLTESKAKGKQ